MSRSSVILVEEVGKLYSIDHAVASTLAERASSLLRRRRRSDDGPPREAESEPFWALRGVSMHVDAGLQESGYLRRRNAAHGSPSHQVTYVRCRQPAGRALASRVDAVPALDMPRQLCNLLYRSRERSTSRTQLE